MNRLRLALLIALLGISTLVFHAQTSAPQPTHKFTPIAPGIYSAIGTGTPNVGSNSAVIVNQDDVLIVDSHISPESARVLLKELKTLTDKPVRFLVNTHFHYDHASGNQVFGPPVEIIGHEFTRRKLTDDILKKWMFADLLAGMPKQLEDLRGRAAAEQDPTAKARLEQQLKNQQAFSQQISETKPTPPNVTLDDRMTLYRGDREIRLLYLGHGHTGGDVVVYLPKERVLCTGDLLVNQIANLIDGYVNEWPDALEKLKTIDFVDVIPGHGEPFKGKERIDWFQQYLRDLWKQSAALHDQKVPSAEAAKRVDMTAHKAHYSSINGPGINPAYMARIYDVMDGRAEY
jgi:glyoxylase-like metal-dependent hydrolase (beta-lactamase superfamily II)